PPPRAAHRAHQGGDHPPRSRARRGLFADALLLRARRRAGVRALRRVRPSAQGLRRGRRPRPDPGCIMTSRERPSAGEYGRELERGAAERLGAASPREGAVSMRLGERLVQDGLVKPEDVDAALQAQVLYGRRLGTNLVELGFLDEDQLGAALARHLDAPLADA